MNDTCRECLVKKQQNGKDKAMRFGMIFLTVLAAFAGLFMIPFALLGAVIFGILTYFVFQNTDLEYEYTLVEKSLDIDKIMAKTRRKRLKSYDLSEADLIAPTKSHRLDYYNNNTNMKVLDFSSGNADAVTYTIIIKDEGAAKVIFEPDETMAAMMHRAMPSKSFLE